MRIIPCTATIFYLIFSWSSFFCFSQDFSEKSQLRNNYRTTKNLLSLDSLDTELLLNAAKIAKKLDLIDESIYYLEKVESLDTSNIEASLLRSEICVSLEEFQNSFDILKKIVDKNLLDEESQVEQVYSNLGLMSMKLKKYDIAVESFQRALGINDQNVNYYLNLGVSRAKSKNLKEGCQDWRRAYELGSERAKEMIIKYCPATCMELFEACN